ncbi:hypothetical protein BH02_1258 [Burkholderia pseudomallei]|nr:hypothetical protein BH02_1258 [Burkholderia pseudomallei]
MAAGTTRYVLICEPVSSADQASATDQAVCPPSNERFFHVQAVQAYVLDTASAGYIDAAAQPFDYGQAAGFWSAAFESVVGLYFACRGIGAVVEMIRRA